MTAPHVAPTRLQRVGPVLWAVAAAGGAVGILSVRDPHEPGSYGSCPFLRLTGFSCPFCGGLRAVNDLTRADVVAALSSNALVVLGLPVLVVLTALALKRRWRGTGPVAYVGVVVPPWLTWLGMAGLLAFTVLRNLAVGAVLAP